MSSFIKLLKNMLGNARSPNYSKRLVDCYTKAAALQGFRISGGSGWIRTTDLTLIRGAL